MAIRRTVFEQAGGWPEEFVRGHEGVDLAWRVMDTGRRVAYAGDIEVLHPSYRTAPHDHSAYYGARNRVFLARRHLPLPLAVLYVAGFALRTLPVLRTPQRARAALRGYRDGLRRPCGDAPPAAGEHAVADDPRRPASDHLSGSVRAGGARQNPSNRADGSTHGF